MLFSLMVTRKQKSINTLNIKSKELKHTLPQKHYFTTNKDKKEGKEERKERKKKRSERRETGKGEINEKRVAKPP